MSTSMCTGDQDMSDMTVGRQSPAAGITQPGTGGVWPTAISRLPENTASIQIVPERSGLKREVSLDVENRSRIGPVALTTGPDLDGVRAEILGLESTGLHRKRNVLSVI